MDPADYSHSDEHYGASSDRASRPIIAIIVVTAVLYFARQIFLPLAMASMLAVVFSPIAGRLERFVGRFMGSALVVLAGVAALAGMIYFFSVELASVAVEVSGYSDNIATKLSALEKSTPAWLHQVEQGMENVRRELQSRQPRQPRQETPRTIQTVPSSSPINSVLKPALPLLAGIAEGLLTIVFLFFLLYSRRDLRDRFVRLAVRSELRVSAQAMETAGSTVSRYLLFFSCINLTYGIAIGAILWLIGLPNPELWGALGFVLRFIPYVGALTSALLPTAVAFAVLPGWQGTVEVLTSFIVLDQIAAQFVEPFFVGHGIGISPVALLISAAYWAWLWGLPGLVLATPLTACIKVAGDYIPALEFFSILLGEDTARESHHDYYRKLLELDSQGAEALAIRYCDEHGLEATLNNIVTPAVILAGAEAAEHNISESTNQFVINAARELIAQLGNRFSKPRNPPPLRVLGVCTPGEVHSFGLLILLELLRQDGIAASFVGEQVSKDDVYAFANRFAPDVVCLTCTLEECVPEAIDVVESLKRENKQLMIIAGGASAAAQAGRLRFAGCAEVCSSANEGQRAVRR
ncbi:MAG: AI-2E family transporter, partial [Candidatus Binataceae bacterium]